jgi:DNA-binding CsgD family transcriptional regulator
VTDETRQAVKKLVQEHKTGVAIAKALKISLPTVQNIKKALGLVRKHG